MFLILGRDFSSEYLHSGTDHQVIQYLYRKALLAVLMWNRTAILKQKTRWQQVYVLGCLKGIGSRIATGVGFVWAYVGSILCLLRARMEWNKVFMWIHFAGIKWEFNREQGVFLSGNLSIFCLWCLSSFSAFRNIVQLFAYKIGENSYGKKKMFSSFCSCKRPTAHSVFVLCFFS